MTARDELPYLAWGAGAALFGAAAGLLAWQAGRLNSNVKSFKADLREVGLRDVTASQNEIKTVVNGFSHGVKQASTDVDRLRHDVILLQRLVSVPQSSTPSGTVLWWAVIVSLVLAIVVSLAVPYPLSLAGGILLLAAGFVGARAFDLSKYAQQKETVGKSQKSDPWATS